jgi:hypothetical protein
MDFFTRIKNAWNAFRENSERDYRNYGAPSGGKTYRTLRPATGSKGMISPILTRIAIDGSLHKFRHIAVDKNDNFLEEIPSELNHCLTSNPNVDQTPSSFFHDVIWSLLDEGVVAIVPVDKIIHSSGMFDVTSLRVGKIREWYPQHVRVDVYDERPDRGTHEEIVLSKREVAIVENPLFATMNEPNSTLRRLISKLSLLDTADAISASGKLDLIIQLPYMIKSQTRKDSAEKRLADIEHQLTNGKHGIAYTDATEKVIQLNRAVENKLLEQVTSLTTALYSQLGLTEGLLAGTASEGELLNYFNRTVDPIVLAITQSMTRVFVPRFSGENREVIAAFRRPFNFATTEALSKVADTFTRNEILSPNEVRAVIGYKPSPDPKADELRNRNLNQENKGAPNDQTEPKETV